MADRGKQLKYDAEARQAILRGVEKLDEKSINEIEELPGEEAIPFLCSKISSFDKIVKEESAGFKKEMVSLAQALK